MNTNKIRNLRIKRQLTQQQVADYCNISLRAYQYIENSERKGDIQVWKKFSELFNTTIDELVK